MSDVKRRLIAVTQAQPETTDYEAIMEALLPVRLGVPVQAGGVGGCTAGLSEKLD